MASFFFNKKIKSQISSHITNISIFENKIFKLYGVNMFSTKKIIYYLTKYLIE